METTVGEPVTGSPAAGAAGTTDVDDFVAARSTVLWRTAFPLTGDRHQAEDLLQVALLKTWRRWYRLERRESAEAYVRRALVTSYTDWWRRRWTGEVPTGQLPDDSAGPRTRPRAASGDQS